MARTPSIRARKPRAEPNGPRRVSVLLKLTNRNGQPIDLAGGDITAQVVMVSSDKRRLFDVLMGDRSLIALEYTPPFSQEAAPAPPVSEAAE